MEMVVKSESATKFPMQLGSVMSIIALSIWGLVPAIVMLVLLLFPAVFSRLAPFWGWAAILWSLSSLALFVFMLYGGNRSGRASRVVQSIAGLTCTLILGLPAVMLSTLPLFGSPQESLESMDPDGTKIQLEEESSAANEDLSVVKEEKVLFIVGIDVSTSFVEGPRDEQLGMIYDALDAIFVPTDKHSFAKSLNTRDLIMYYAFAGKNRLLHKNDENGEGRESLRIKPSEVLPFMISPLLSPEKGKSNSTDLERKTTDLVGFIDGTVCAQIRDRSRSFSRVKVILFSDLIHSVPEKLGAAGADAIKERKDTLDKIEECIGNSSNPPTSTPVSVTAFFLKARGGAREELAGDDIDIGRYMTSNLSNAQWEEVDLEDYSRADWEKRALMCTNLYARIVSKPPIYLKYHPLPNWEALESWLVLPKTRDTNKIFLGLRPVEDNSTSVKIRFGKGVPEDFVLGLGSRDRTDGSLDRSATEQNPLRLTVDKYPNIPRDAHCELLVGVPMRSILYRIPVVVLSVMPIRTMLLVKSIVTIMHFFPLVLAVAISIETIKRSRQVNGRNS
jgi:hypothetical protein